MNAWYVCKDFPSFLRCWSTSPGCARTCPSSLETWPGTPILPKRSFSQRRLSLFGGFLRRLSYATMPYKTVIRLFLSARNGSNGFPARLLVVPISIQLGFHINDDVVVLSVAVHAAATPGHLLEDFPQVAVGTPQSAGGSEDLEAGYPLRCCFTSLSDYPRGYDPSHEVYCASPPKPDWCSSNVGAQGPAPLPFILMPHLNTELRAKTTVSYRQRRFARRHHRTWSGT